MIEKLKLQGIIRNQIVAQGSKSERTASVFYKNGRKESGSVVIMRSTGPFGTVPNEYLDKPVVVTFADREELPLIAEDITVI